MTDYDLCIQFRYEHDLNPGQLALLLGFSPRAIWQIEWGRIPLQESERAKLEEFIAKTRKEIAELMKVLNYDIVVPHGKPGFSMPIRRRECLAWRWHKDLTFEEAAELLNMPVEKYRIGEGWGGEGTSRWNALLPAAIRTEMRNGIYPWPPLPGAVGHRTSASGLRVPFVGEKPR